MDGSGIHAKDSKDLPVVVLVSGRESLARVLRKGLRHKIEYAVTVVGGTEQAMAAVSDTAPVAVFVEIGIADEPVIGEFVRQIRADDTWSSVPLVAIKKPDGFNHECRPKSSPVDQSGSSINDFDLTVTEPLSVSDLRLAIHQLARDLDGMGERASAASQTLREQDRDQAELWRFIGHDLRGPLTVIKSSLSMLARFNRTSPSAELIEAASDATTRLANMVDNLVFGSHPDDEPATLDGTQTNDLFELTDVVREILPGLQIARDVREATLKTEIPDAGITVHGNRALIKAALVNAFLNAAEHSPIDGAVRVSAYRQDDMAVVAVADDGVLVPADVSERVFERESLVRLKARGTRIGRGLDLVVLREITERHDGVVAVEVSDNGRHVLKLKLPFA